MREKITTVYIAGKNSTLGLFLTMLISKRGKNSMKKAFPSRNLSTALGRLLK